MNRIISFLNIIFYILGFIVISSPISIGISIIMDYFKTTSIVVGVSSSFLVILYVIIEILENKTEFKF